MAEPGDLRWSGDARSPVHAVRHAVSGDPADLPDRLCRALAVGCGLDGAAMSTLTETPLRHRLGSSDELAELLETVQFTVGEGPCVQAAATGNPVIVEDLHVEADVRWPGFADLAAQRLGGIGAVFGFALGVDGVTFGSVNLYSRTRRALTPAEIAEISQAVTIAAASLLASPQSFTDPIADEAMAAPAAAYPWPAMHLAIGIIAGLLDIAPSEALARMRAHALTHDMLLTELTTQILTDRLDPSELNR